MKNNRNIRTHREDEIELQFSVKHAHDCVITQQFSVLKFLLYLYSPNMNFNDNQKR